MDINSFPLEILQEILSYLSIDQLKVVCLVCHHWNRISTELFARKAQLRIKKKNLRKIGYTTRRYRSIVIDRLDTGKLLQSAVSKCLRRFPNLREISLAHVYPNHLHWVYQRYPNWVNQCVSLTVSLNNHALSSIPEDYSLTFPNLKQLQWTDNFRHRYQKVVTIDAPKLEKVCVHGGFRDSCIRILHCERLKHIWFKWYDKQFLDIFTGDFGNLETLILFIERANFDIDFLANIRQLQYLSLVFKSDTDALPKVKAMRRSKFLKFLCIESCDGTAKGALNLERMFNRFENLESLGLYGINLTDDNSIHASQLKFFHLREVRYSGSIISLYAPKLRSLAVPGEVLEKLQLNESEHLSDLRVVVYYMISPVLFDRLFQKTMVPFIAQHKNLKSLTLTSAELNVSHDLMADSVEHLKLGWLDVSLDFFRSLAKWKSLKSLKLVNCTIDCMRTPDDVVRLPRVELITTSCVRVINSTTDFPIQGIAARQDIFINYVNKRNPYTVYTLDFGTTRQEKFQPFMCPELILEDF